MSNPNSAGHPTDLSMSVTQLIDLTTNGDRQYNTQQDEVVSRIGQVYRITLGEPYPTFTAAYAKTPLRMAACINKDCIIVGQYKSYFVKHKDGVLLGMASPIEYVAEDTVWHVVLEYSLVGAK